MSAVFAVRGMGTSLARGAGEAADLSLLPRTLRRGLSAAMKAAVEASGRALAEAGLGKGDLPIVYGSAIGETQTAIELLTSIDAAQEASPVLFRHSVHNAAAGLLSIALESRAGSIAIAAGSETLALALVEAASLLGEGATAVLLVVSEEGAPTQLAPDRRCTAGAVAWVLSAGKGPARAYLTAPQWARDHAAKLAEGAGDTLAPALALATLLAQVGDQAGGGADGVRTINLSPRQPWQVRVAVRREALAT